LGSEAPKKRDADEPFRLLLVGDFSGRGARRVPRPELRRPRRVDVAELEQVFAAFGAEL
jgi:hypothetical protein